jgi:hypothetical protein
LTYYFSKIKIVWVIYVFLHLGGDEIVHVKDIVVMMDMEKTTISAITREFLRTGEEEGFIKTILEDEIPKSFVVAYKNCMQVIYLSPLSVSTLYRRYKKLETMRKKSKERNGGTLGCQKT